MKKFKINIKGTTEIFSANRNAALDFLEDIQTLFFTSHFKFEGDIYLTQFTEENKQFLKIKIVGLFTHKIINGTIESKEVKSILNMFFLTHTDCFKGNIKVKLVEDMAKKLNLNVKGKITSIKGKSFTPSDKENIVQDFKNFVKSKDYHFAGDVNVEGIE